MSLLALGSTLSSDCAYTGLVQMWHNCETVISRQLSPLTPIVQPVRVDKITFFCFFFYRYVSSCMCLSDYTEHLIILSPLARHRVSIWDNPITLYLLLDFAQLALTTDCQIIARNDQISLHDTMLRECDLTSSRYLIAPRCNDSVLTTRRLLQQQLPYPIFCARYVLLEILLHLLLLYPTLRPQFVRLTPYAASPVFSTSARS